MKSKRRDFLKAFSLAGFGLAGSRVFGKIPSRVTVKESIHPGTDEINKYQHAPRFNMSGYKAPKLDTVRIGVIGLGQRGPGHVKNMSRIEGVEIAALCDLRPEKAEAVKKSLEGTGHNPEIYTGTDVEWKKLCESKNLDLVIVTTPTYMHAKMAVYAMEQGKHVCSEVPAATSLEDCWKLVETSERTRKHCMMMENYSYMPFHLLTISMAKQGFFGEVVHGDGAYNTSKMGNNFNKNMYWNMWWLRLYGSYKGNIYPTHGLGPIAQIMEINRGDKFEFLVSVSSRDFMMGAKAKELAKTDDFFDEFAKMEYRGNMSSTLIKTTMGRTINLQHDATSPSPHNLIHGIYGTKGSALFDPHPPRLCTGNHQWAGEDEFKKLEKKYTPEISRRIGEIAKSSGHGGSDLMQDWHIIDCLRNGLPLDQDVYDAAAFSSVMPLSDLSVRENSRPVEIPDFTAGAWKKNDPNMDIFLDNGGGNTKIIR